VRIGGLVVARQRPGTAKGIVFLLLEDEHGTINLIVSPEIYERRRLIVRSEPLVIATGRLEKLARGGGQINVFVHDIAALHAPAEGLADVVELDERRPGDAERVDLGDFRSVAPPVMSFAAGRSR
jgi:error-prone DNA polymerase